MGAYGAIATILGIVVIALASRDVFHEVFHPAGSGRASRLAAAVVGRLACRVRSLSNLVGPIVLLTVLGMWSAGFVLGFALIAWPHIPTAFHVDGALTGNATWVTALYVSAVTMATLGYGDVTPREEWLQLLMPLEALIGFGLVTSAISWIISIYPVLLRRRALAQQLHLVSDRIGVAETSGYWLAPVLVQQLQQLTIARADVRQFSITHHFSSSNEREELSSALTVAIPALRALSMRDNTADVGPLPDVLLQAVDDLLDTVAEDIYRQPGMSSDQVLERLVTERKPRR